MALLTRYKKNGGFVQLIKLIETCGPAKQEKLLKNVEEEDPRWAKALRQKMLTVDRIFTWESDILGDIVKQTKELTLAVMFHGVPEEYFERSMVSSSHSQRRKLERLMSEQNASLGEVNTAKIQLIEVVRGMVVDGYIRLQEVDSQLLIRNDIEEHLSKLPIDGSSKAFLTPAKEVEVAPTTESNEMAEKEPSPVKIDFGNDLKKAENMLMQFAQENKSLNMENLELKAKVSELEAMIQKLSKNAA